MAHDDTIAGLPHEQGQPGGEVTTTDSEPTLALPPIPAVDPAGATPPLEDELGSDDIIDETDLGEELRQALLDAPAEETPDAAVAARALVAAAAEGVAAQADAASAARAPATATPERPAPAPPKTTLPPHAAAVTGPFGERRLDARAAVELWLEHRDGDAVSFYLAHNLSAGGVCLRDAVLRGVGALLPLTLRLPDDGEPLAVVGTVVQVRLVAGQPITHLRFEGLDGAAHIRIDGYVEGLLSHS